MNFLTKLFREIAFVPLLVLEVERMLGQKSGAEKKNAALLLMQTTMSVTHAVATKKIVDAGEFQDGLGKVIDGVVQCLNASAWAKKKLSRGSALAAGGCGLPERSRMVN
jgi:hypothetical protein